MNNLLKDFAEEKVNWDYLKKLSYTERQKILNQKHRAERTAAIETGEKFQTDIDNVPPPKAFNRRRLRQAVPEDVQIFADPTFKMDTKSGAITKDLEAQGMMQYFEEQGIGSEQGRRLSVQKEHAISIAGDPNEIPKATPTDYNVKHRGSDYYKSQFSGSGRYNVRLGQFDSFNLEQMRTIGRPVNWWEAAADHKGFGDGVMIDISNEDWLNLQQGKITDNQLVSHKMQVDMEAQRGNIWIDADSADEIIQDIDTAEGKRSLQKHYQKDVVEGTNLKARTIKGKVKPDPKDFKFTKLDVADVTKHTGKFRQSEIIARLGADVTAGNVPGAFINASALSVHLAAQNPTVQKNASKVFMEVAKMSEPAKKNLRRQIIKHLGKRGAKSVAKLAPGADVAISALEVKGYLAEGKMDQAAIASLSGAVGWVPVAGDFVACLLDMTNTAIDITRMDFSGKPEIDKGPEIVELQKKRASGVLTNKAMDAELKRLGITKEFLESYSASGFQPRTTVKGWIRSAK